MNKTIIWIIVIAVIVIGGFLIYGAFAHQSTPATTGPATYDLNSLGMASGTPDETPTTPAPTPSVVTIDIKNFAFNPAAMFVKVGTTVTWVNDDSAPHTVTSDSGTVLNSPTLQPGQSYSVTLNDLGTVSYHCKIHPSMHGTITVTSGLGS